MKNPEWFEPTSADRLVFAQEMLLIAVSEAVNEAIEKRGTNRAELARRCGITRSALSQRLSGRKSMTLATAAEMLHHLEFHLEVELVDDSNVGRAGLEPATQGL